MVCNIDAPEDCLTKRYTGGCVLERDFLNMYYKENVNIILSNYYDKHLRNIDKCTQF